MRSIPLYIGLLFTLHLYAQTDRIDSLMNVFVDRMDFSGTVLYADKGEVIYHEAFGLADREWQVPNTIQSRYRLASLGKVFTSLLILQLAEEKKLALSDPLIKYIPEYKVAGAEKITLQQILSHTSGIPNYHAVPDFDEVEAKLSRKLEEFVQLFLDKPLLFDPGTDQQYSNLAYSVLALVAERVSRVSFNQLLHTRIFEKAGMTDTYTEDERRVMPHTARGYVNSYSEYLTSTYRDPSSVIGSGNVTSTAMDLFHFDRALRAGKLLSPEFQKQWYRPVKGDYALGWMVMRYPVPGSDSVSVTYHDGGNSGFSTVMYRFLENDRCLIVLANVSPMDIYGVAGRLGRLIHNRPVSPVRRSLVAQFARELEKNGLEAAVRSFRVAKEDPDYELDGKAFNFLGYTYLRSGRVIEAVEVFKLNVEAHPGVANAYDSLGEGYMKQGNKALALENYRRSLELDPSNSNAKVMIEKLLATDPK